MHGVPPGGKIQLLHMAEEDDDNEWEEREVELSEENHGASRPILRDFN